MLRGRRHQVGIVQVHDLHVVKSQLLGDIALVLVVPPELDGPEGQSGTLDAPPAAPATVDGEKGGEDDDDDTSDSAAHDDVDPVVEMTGIRSAS